MGNSFGTCFKITTWGESHGKSLGVIIDGCPPHLKLTEADIQHELDRRRPGQSHITTPRDEGDCVEIVSGIFEGKTTGTPLTLIIQNKDQNSKAYDHLKDVYRPSHADFTYDAKYGIRDYRGGGRASARETAARVAAGAVAQIWLKEQYNVEIISYVKQVHEIRAAVDTETVSRVQVDSNIVRCPAPEYEAMIQAIEAARKEGDSLGGIVGTVIRGVPAGWGEPVFDKLKADFAKAMMSIPATMGFQVGAGFEGAKMKGSMHNDPFYWDEDRIRTKTNHSGGIQGGISNGEDILFEVAFKPTGTIFKAQETVTKMGLETQLAAKGRHDPCVLPRAVPIVDAMAALVLMDHALRQKMRV